jgi:prolyl-tRNA editing enzyme YbaK/EbsC (Cys-tRNA(Pro) deacylase)
MNAKLSGSARKVQDALTAAGVEAEVVELPASTRTSAEAAAAVGCSIGQIAKSVVFRTGDGETPVLVVASGANRVNEAKLQDVIGRSVQKADAEFVRKATGFSIGGVPPFGHEQPVTVVLDQDLMQWEYVWAAAGTPNAVVRLRPADLQRLAGGGVHSIK